LKLSLLIDFNPRVNVVARICRKLYGDDPAHGWPHILRVMAWAERIVNSEGLDVDPEVLVVFQLHVPDSSGHEGLPHQPQVCHVRHSIMLYP
jgi:hypothetical protein